MPIRMFGFPKSYRSTLAMFYAQRNVSLDLASTSKSQHARRVSAPDFETRASRCTDGRTTAQPHYGQTPKAYALRAEVPAEVLH